MVKVRASMTGGNKLKARLRSDQRRDREVHGKVISVGFHDKRMASLAAILEYGEPQTNLPERPAFRLTSRGDMLDKARAKLLEIGKRPGEGIATSADLRELAVLLRDALKAGYLTFHGVGQSARQERRKQGTKGEGRELVGAQGPKLIEHIEAWVNGVEAA